MPRSCVVLAVGLVLALSACAEDPSPAAAGTTAPGPQVSGDVVVLAAASLTDVLTGLAQDFETAHPGTHVRLSFAGSSALAQQVVAGAPADVLATASTATMATVVEAGDVDGDPVTVARNELEIAVPAGNPGGVTGVADLADPDLRVALCAEQVPCGAAASTLLALDDVEAQPDTLEPDVRAVLSRVQLGEVDAGLVYRTDVIAAGDGVEGVAVAGADRASTDYPVAVLAGAPHPEAARAFRDLVRSPTGTAALAGAGFETP